MAFVDRRCRQRLIRSQGVAAPRRCRGAAATREKPEEANPDEALRQHVKKNRRRNSSALTVMSATTPVRVVLPPKRDLVVGHMDKPMIRDGDAMRVAREVVQHVARPTKGGLA